MNNAPHVHCGEKTSYRMRDALIALAPSAIAACSFHGIPALVRIAAAIVASGLSQVIFNLPLRRRIGLGDLSFAVTGLICALLLPAGAVWYAAAIAACAAQLTLALFGGLGRNYVNPALLGTVLVYALRLAAPDGTLAALMQGARLNAGTWQVFLGGPHHGALGMTSPMLLLLGWLYLLLRGRARPLFSVSFLFAMAAVLLPLGAPPVSLLCGEALLIGLYCGSDSVTTPIHRRGQVILGLAMGLLAAALRYFLHFEGALVAMLLAGPLSRLTDWLLRKA